MAKLECELQGSFRDILNDIESAVMGGSISATCEARSDFSAGDSRCSVRVFERYSCMGGNRVSMNVTLFEAADRIFVTAVTSGGSQALFFKVNTFGESAFLDTVRDVISGYSRRSSTDDEY